VNGDVKLCNRCGKLKPLTPEFWYVQRARDGHPTPGWQSHCRECWREINRLNKQRIRKSKKAINVGSGLGNLELLTSVTTVPDSLNVESATEPIVVDTLENTIVNE